jgi:hypothetical protein
MTVPTRKGGGRLTFLKFNVDVDVIGLLGAGLGQISVAEDTVW